MQIGLELLHIDFMLGYYVLVGGNLISWKRKKQLVARLSAKEYVIALTTL